MMFQYNLHMLLRLLHFSNCRDFAYICIFSDVDSNTGASQSLEEPLLERGSLDMLLGGTQYSLQTAQADSIGRCSECSGIPQEHQ